MRSLEALASAAKDCGSYAPHRAKQRFVSVRTYELHVPFAWGKRREAKIIVASIDATLVIPKSVLAVCMASVAPAMNMSIVGVRIPVNVNTRPSFMWTKTKPTFFMK